MNELLTLLSGGDLRSDGLAEEVADAVLLNPKLFDQLMAGLELSDDVVRGRSTDALERISRTSPEYLLPYLARLIRLSQEDKVAMVRWHLAMIFGNLSFFPEITDDLVAVLFDQLADPSAFVKSWAVASLAIIGKGYLERRGEILDQIARLRNDGSIAVRTRANKALTALENDEIPLPNGWIKSRRL
jgi:HEAT repeat protein